LIKRELSKAIFLLLTFLTTGLGFVLVANLPFEPINDGILERFYILPNFIIIFTIGSAIKYFGKYNKYVLVVLVISLITVFKNSFVRCNYREYFLNYDYGKNILRTLPKDSILFMDGGDDTFYTLAYLKFGKKLRQDIRLHDRGGLVFKNVYGKDFRFLTKEEKNVRRLEVEKSFVNYYPVYYSTFNDDLFPGEKLIKAGILYYKNSKNFLLPNNELLEEIYSYREVDKEYFDYRSKALVPIYYFMKGLNNDIELGYKYLKYALLKWPEVDWLKNNCFITLHKIGFTFFNQNRFQDSIEVYNTILKFNPNDEYALLNLGASLEKVNKYDLAKKQYEKVLELNKNNVNAYYNMAVLSWKENDWDNVIKYFTEVLRLQPDNLAAKKFLFQAIKNKNKK
jgi:tetratricopeptide (TPR) repeat protein